MSNRDVKLAAAGAGVRMWQIADELGILDCNLSRKLRRELSPEEKAQMFEIIKRLSGGDTDAQERD